MHQSPRMFFHLPLSRKKMKGRRLLGSYSLNFPLPVSVCPIIENELKKKKIGIPEPT